PNGSSGDSSVRFWGVPGACRYIVAATSWQSHKYRVLCCRQRGGKDARCNWDVRPKTPSAPPTAHSIPGTPQPKGQLAFRGILCAVLALSISALDESLWYTG